ncbi:MAG: monofunctional biosynthetic peptidoglycan transglycosylase [Nitrospinae bacterium]|nr:monofunctional biosynthetic peptidoglycan transglycosylase [Nitrospinota bacterium]
MVRYVFKGLVGFLAFIGFIVVGIAGWVSTFFIWPDISHLKTGIPKKTAFMEFRERQWAEGNKKVKLRYTWTPLAEISPFVQDAVLISEDDKFWQHYGFDLAGIQDALEKNMRSGTMKAGGSTITQQLAKNIFLSPEKTAMRKLKEAFLTLRLERELGKKRILELYLNVAEWGTGIFGIEEAARRHYGKHASQLTPDEACRLAAVLPNPIRFSPTGDSRYVETRANAILGVMQKRDKGLSIWEDLRKDTLLDGQTENQDIPLVPALPPGPDEENAPAP